MPTEKVLIYRSSICAEASRVDLRKLLINYGLFPAVDVGDFDEHTTLDQLNPKTTTVVIPGGAACYMGAELQVKKPALTKLFQDGSNGVFICAGGYIAADYMRMCVNTTKPGKIYPSESYYSLQLTDYTAIGPFIPDMRYSQGCEDRKYKYYPYCANLNFFPNSSASFNSSQIYVAGCGFIKDNSLPRTSNCLFNASSFDVVAEYSIEKHSFVKYEVEQKEHEEVLLPKMSAIIQRKPLGGYGGFFVSGVHVEACVENSQMFKEITQDRDEKIVCPLSNPDEYDPEKALSTILPVLEETLTRKPLGI